MAEDDDFEYFEALMAEADEFEARALKWRNGIDLKIASDSDIDDYTMTRLYMFDLDIIGYSYRRAFKEAFKGFNTAIFARLSRRTRRTLRGSLRTAGVLGTLKSTPSTLVKTTVEEGEIELQETPAISVKVIAGESIIKGKIVRQNTPENTLESAPSTPVKITVEEGKFELQEYVKSSAPLDNTIATTSISVLVDSTIATS